MKAKNYLSAILILLSCYSYKAEAQSKLGFSTFQLNKDSLYLGDTLQINTVLYNYDTVAYNDIVSFGLKINGVQNVNEILFPNPFYDSVISIPSISGAPFNGIQAIFKIVITPAYFDIGPDILVVWPIARDLSPPYSSIYTTIYVLGTPVDSNQHGVGFKSLNFNPGLKAYYRDNLVYLKAIDAGIALNRVSIFDLTGREVLNEPTNGSQPIPFSLEADGVYFVEVYFNEGETAVYKIAK